MSCMSDSFTIGSPLRAALGMVLLGGAISVLMVSRTIDWGVAWTAVIPAVALIVPAWALMQRQTLSWTDGKITVTSGWLWRRAMEFKTTQAELELLPTAGLMAVVLHRGASAHPLATFILPRTAQKLATWLDQHHPGGAFVRKNLHLPEADR